MSEDDTTLERSRENDRPFILGTLQIQEQAGRVFLFRLYQLFGILLRARSQQSLNPALGPRA